MKKSRFFYLAMMLCTLAFGLTSCEKDDNDGGSGSGSGSSSTSIVGYWEPYSTEYEVYYEGELLYEEEDTEDYGDWGYRFDDDGKFYYWEEEDGDVETYYGGKYTYKNNKITITEDGETMTFKVSTLTSSKMAFEYSETVEEEGYEFDMVATINFNKVNF
jgi:uncharacterized protein YgiB involved in biofilm formation